MSQATMPDGIFGHPFEPRKPDVGPSAGTCAYCGKPKAHPAHEGPFTDKPEPRP